MILTHDELHALRVFADGPQPVTALRARFSRTRSYALAKRLVDLGALQRDGTARALTPGGQAALAAAATAVVAPAVPTLADVIPHLQLAPTAPHRAFLGLGLCARVARKHRLRRSHHPSLVATGPTARFKTWAGRALVLMCGGQPASDVIYLGVESGRSLLTRKQADGTRIKEHPALSVPVVVLDEWLRAKPDVRKLVEVYLFGETEVADEDGPLKVEAVPVVTLNPRPGKTYEEQLGLDEAMLRRAIVFPLDTIRIPDHLLADGDDLLEQLHQMGPVAMPAPAVPELDVRPQVQALLRQVLDVPDRLARIDITMLAMLVTAATAWLPPAAALRAVMHDYLTLAELSGWTVPDWRRALPSGLAPGADADADHGGGAGHTSGEEAPNVVLAYDYERHLTEIAAACEHRRLAPADAVALLDRLRRLEAAGFTVAAAEALRGELVPPDGDARTAVAALATAAQQHGAMAAAITAAQAKVTAIRADGARLTAARDRVGAELRRLHWTPAHVDSLLHTEGVLKRLDLSPEDLERLAAFVQPVVAATATTGPITVEWVAALCQVLAADGTEGQSAVGASEGCEWIARVVRNGLSLHDALATLREACNAAGAERDAMCAERDAALREYRSVQQQVRALRECEAALPQRVAAAEDELRMVQAASLAARDQLAVARELLCWLRGAGAASAALHQALLAVEDAEEISPALGRIADTLARRQALAIVRSTLEPDLIPRWEVPWLRYRMRAEERTRVASAPRAERDS